MLKEIEKIREGLLTKGISLKSRETKKWLLNKIQRLKMSPRRIVNQYEKAVAHPEIGKMYFYYYDPKTKEKLSFYDKFPLVLPIDLYADGFLGLNFHYLDIDNRLKLIAALMQYKNNNRMDDRTKLLVTYQTLKRLKNLRAFRPCLKRYLNPYIKSQIIEITVPEMEMAIILPVERFQKMSKKKVHEHSRSMI